jgi:hypothetical protein
MLSSIYFATKKYYVKTINKFISISFGQNYTPHIEDNYTENVSFKDAAGTVYSVNLSVVALLKCGSFRLKDGQKYLHFSSLDRGSSKDDTP